MKQNEIWDSWTLVTHINMYVCHTFDFGVFKVILGLLDAPNCHEVAYNSKMVHHTLKWSEI